MALSKRITCKNWKSLKGIMAIFQLLKILKKWTSWLKSNHWKHNLTNSVSDFVERNLLMGCPQIPETRAWEQKSRLAQREQQNERVRRAHVSNYCRIMKLSLVTVLLKHLSSSVQAAVIKYHTLKFISQSSEISTSKVGWRPSSGLKTVDFSWCPHIVKGSGFSLECLL